MEFIEILLKIIKQKGISEHKLCTETKIAKSSIDNWKKGSLPSIDKLIKISLYLGTTPNDLLGIYNNNELELTEEEQDLLNYFRRLPEKKQMRFLGRLEAEVDNIINAEVEENKQETKSSTLKSG